MTKQVQNCPLCGSKGDSYKGAFGVMVRCSNNDLPDRCVIYEAHFNLETWNRIRIAPDDEIINTVDIDEQFVGGVRTSDCNEYDVELSGGEYTLSKNWMNPQYPKESDETRT